MFEVRNRMNQEYPLDIVKNGKNIREFVPAKETVYTEEITPVIERLEKKRKVMVKEVKESKKSKVKEEDDE